MEIQLSTYAKKNFMGLIRTKSKKKSLICKNRLNALYSRMRNDDVEFDGLHLVESIHDDKFVQYVEELENERQSNSDSFDDDHISSDDESDVDTADSGNSYMFAKLSEFTFVSYFQKQTVLYVELIAQCSSTINVHI